MKVAILDIDGVLAKQWEAVLAFRKLDGRRHLPVPSNWDMSDWPDDDREHAWSLFDDPKFMRGLMPMRGQLVAAHYLAQHYTLLAMTARANNGTDVLRQDEHVRQTKLWISEWQWPIKEVIFCPSHLKAYIAEKEFGSDLAFAVDDSASIALDYAKKGIMSYLVAASYNAEVKDQANLRRLANLSMVLEHRRLVDGINLPPMVPIGG